jgi:hypothetical protein
LMIVGKLAEQFVQGRANIGSVLQQSI